MGLTPVERSDADITRSDVAAAAAVGRCKPARDRPAPRENTRSGTSKLRRPDRAVYVPRALRTADTHSGNSSSEETKSPPDTNKCPKSPDKSQPETPKKIQNKNFCNVYTPPHLRSQRSHTAPSVEERTVPSVCQVPNSDSAITYSDNSCNNHIEVGDNFYIGDYFVSGPLGFYNPDCYIDCSAQQDPEYSTDTTWSPNESNISMADTTLPVADRSDIINNGYSYSKDEDAEEIELKRASQEINRSSKRIIKQTFNSDVLVISEPLREAKEETIAIDRAPEKKEPEPKKPKQKLEPRVSLKREDNDWDAVFDDSGECLDPSLLEELTATVGRVQISKARNNYEHYQTRGQALCNGPFDETFAHVIEVYDFPSEFKTNDLLSVFSEYKDTGFEIKWVDDTHALIVFSSAKIAGEVLSAQRPLVRCRPLHAATLESRNKAKKCAEFLQPYRQRPETCTALARRLVSGALGVRLSTAQQERAEERRLITLAREKKRQAALHKEAAWEGSLANQSAPDA